MSKPPTSPTLGAVDLFPKKPSCSWRGMALSEHVRLTYSGRAGIYQYLSALACSLKNKSRNIVLIPAFHCPTVIDPVLHANFKIRFYSVTEKLQIDRDDFLRKLDKNVAAALFIRYFGIGDIPHELKVATREAGAKVIHDCSHSFLKSAPLGIAGTQADAAIYSFWKLLPSATIGGGVWCNDETVTRFWPAQTFASLAQRSVFYRQMLVEVKDCLFHFITHHIPRVGGDDQQIPQPVIRKSSEEAYPYDEKLAGAAIHGLARYVLDCADLRRVSEFRRQHYEAFIRALSDHSHLKVLFTSLAADDVPWGVPLMLHRRDERDYLLRGRGLPIFSFGEVLHPLLFEAQSSEPQMVTLACELSRNLIGVAVHQQLNVSMMREYACITNQFLSGLA